MTLNDKIKRLERKIQKLNRKCDRQKRGVIRRLRQARIDVREAIIHELHTNEIDTYKNGCFRIDQETGECVDYLIYFPNYDYISRIRYYLNAYLTTNREFLEPKDIVKLEKLLEYFE